MLAVLLLFQELLTGVAMQTVKLVLFPLPIPLFLSSGKTTSRPKSTSAWAVMLQACVFQLQGILLCPALDLVKDMVRCAVNIWLAFAEGKIPKSLSTDNSFSRKERKTGKSQSHKLTCVSLRQCHEHCY